MIPFRITFEGTGAGLLMHSSVMADPLDPKAKALKRLTKKLNKTDEDHREMQQVEMSGGMYHDPDIGPYIPSDNIWRCLYDAGKRRKLGVKIKEGLLIDAGDDGRGVNPLSYTGPRDKPSLIADANFRFTVSCKIGVQRVMRTRPLFRNWRVDAEGVLDPNVLDLAELEQVAEMAGLYVGLGDWRPRYGRFVSTVTAI